MRSRACFQLVFTTGCIVCGLAGCSDAPGEISRDSEPFGGIAESAVISAGGTEPFWSLTVTPAEEGYAARYSTPDSLNGSPFPVSRFAGNNGLSFSGLMDGKAVSVTLTPNQECSDGMSDRLYPYTATMLIGDVTLYGCAHTDLEPFVEEGES